MKNSPKPRFDAALAAWGTPEFESVLKQELARAADALPLQRGLTVGSQVTDAPVTAVIHSVTTTEEVIRVKAGIFYSSVIGGCSCADDPTPVGENTEYCELLLEIDRATAEVSVALVTG
ncbi:MAG: hypothetical protein A2Z95_09520 [Gallionellales bacterium GWA2_60_18]|nr:MAG: hypothetical protein A2Z95_09520 [Gallionellales bacterium GWA2_60_18]